MIFRKIKQDGSLGEPFVPLFYGGDAAITVTPSSITPVPVNTDPILTDELASGPVVIADPKPIDTVKDGDAVAFKNQFNDTKNAFGEDMNFKVDTTSPEQGLKYYRPEFKL